MDDAALCFVAAYAVVAVILPISFLLSSLISSRKRNSNLFRLHK